MNRKFQEGLSLLGDLATVIKTKKNAIWTNQNPVLLLNERPRTIARTKVTAEKFIQFSRLMVLFSLQL